MTIEKAIEEIQFNMSRIGLGARAARRVKEAKEMAITALEEIQQYRAIIGLTPEDLKALEKDEIQTIGDALKAFSEWNQYKEIGTVSEFRQLKEKATAKKPIPFVPDCTSIRFLEFVCPNCKEKVQYILMPPYCKCGQKLLYGDWSEGKE